MQINTNRDGTITWDELVSHLLLGFIANDPENQRESLEPPILGLPKVIRSMHRHPISRICFNPDVAKVILCCVIVMLINNIMVREEVKVIVVKLDIGPYFK